MTKLIAGALVAASLLGTAAITVAPTEASAQPYYGRHHGYRPYYRHYGYRHAYRPVYGHRYYGRHYRHW